MKIERKTTVFSNFVIRVKHSTVAECIEEIRKGTYRAQVEEIRKVNEEKGKDAADLLKKKLPAFTPSGLFDTFRRIDSITEYNQCIVIDLDDISEDRLQSAKDTATLAPFTLAVFLSPRGTGIKIIVAVDSELENHSVAFQQVADYFEQALQENIDASGKDISRLCFMSYDPDLYYNPDADVFKVTLQENHVAEKELKLSDDEIFDKVIEFTNKKSVYSEGNRNNYIHLLACNCNRCGIPQGIAEKKITARFDLDDKEIETSVKSAYERNPGDFAKYSKDCNTANFANFATSANNEGKNNQVDALASMPCIPQSVYDALPEILKRGADAFVDDNRKRDVFLTSALTILSGCLPNVTGIYHQERVYPNLFCFIIAPAANGKGVLKNAKRLADAYHHKLCEQSAHSKQEYETELIQYKATVSKLKKDEEPPEKPQEPPFRRVFIPADTSQAMLVKVINDNDGKGIICETEADTMSGANKQDWGNYSHIMRGSFHHEKVSVARKSANEVLEIDEPKISICLSGTPAQVPRLIASAEDGLFSRFMFYAFRSPIVWRSPAPQEHGIVYNDHFKELSAEVLQMVEMLEQNPTEIKLTKDQWTRFDEQFAFLLEQTVLFNNDDVAGVVYRLGLITFRICMQFTALRKFENGDASKIVYCTDEDFNTAVALSKVYIEHSVLMFNNLSEAEKEIKYKLPASQSTLLAKLPDEFRRKEAIAVGKDMGLSERTIDGILQKLVPEILSKIKDGHYRKIHDTV